MGSCNLSVLKHTSACKLIPYWMSKRFDYMLIIYWKNNYKNGSVKAKLESDKVTIHASIIETSAFWLAY